MTRWLTCFGFLFAFGIAMSMAPSIAMAGGDATAGKATYTTFCASCHGDKGDGLGPVGAALEPKPRSFVAAAFTLDTDKDGKKGTDADLTNVIKNGAGQYGGSPMMTPWGHLSEADIANLVAYIRTFKK